MSGIAIQTRAPNGPIVTHTYDALNRVTSRAIEVGPGVAADTTSETYAYDGLSRRKAL